jgi:peptidoglycan/LPS O-acetylase OafA/YrhL
VTGIFILLFFLPLAILQTNGGTYSLNVCTIKSLVEPFQTVKWTWQLCLSATMIVLLSGFTVFMYKKRKLQRLLCIAGLVLILVFCFYTGYYMFGAATSTTPTIWVILPVIACVLNVLAMNKISADEKLIRSLDRIR